jgi:hypothetical protein
MFEKYRFGRSVNGEVENEKKQEGSMRTFLVAILLFAASSANAQQVAPAPKFIRENSPVIALTHVQLIDGTGAAAQATRLSSSTTAKLLRWVPRQARTCRRARK